MTISHAYKTAKAIMRILENVDFAEYKTLQGRLANQKKVNKAYKQLDNFIAELEREIIKEEQRKEASKDA